VKTRFLAARFRDPFYFGAISSRGVSLGATFSGFNGSTRRDTVLEMESIEWVFYRNEYICSRFACITDRLNRRSADA